MGATTSKHPSNRDGWNAPLSRTVSLPTNNVKVEAESFIKSSWKSRPFSMRTSGITGNDLSRGSGKSENESGDVPLMKPFPKLKPVIEDEAGPDYEDRFSAVGARESMEGLHNDFRSRQASSADASEARKRRLLGRSVSFHPAQEVDVDLRSSVWRKRFNEDEFGREKPSFLGPGFSSMANPTYSLALPSRSFSSIDRSTGLRLLLNPVATPSPSSTSAARSATLSKTLSLNGRLNMRVGATGFSGLRTTKDISRSPSMRESTASRPERMATPGGLAEPSSPLFDPSILASFEKAVEALSDDSWQSSDVSTSRSSGIVSSSPDTCSDADSAELLRARGANLDGLNFLSTLAASEGGTFMGSGSASLLSADAVYNKKLSFSKVSPLDDRDWNRQDSLENFEMRCPPSGEGKIVLYSTSLRGIRKTFEDCCTLRLILDGFRMHVDERDTWMHSKFRQELTELMGVALSVPRLFIKGRYIGGAEEVKQMHEEGILIKLFEGLPTEWKKACDGCGGVRFIPCTTCCGSCKMVTQDDTKLRCPDCNENGLIMCPLCA